MKNTEFYLKKSNDLLEQLQGVNTEQLNTDIRNHDLKHRGLNIDVEIKTENLDILNELEFQIKLLLSSHNKSDLFLDRLRGLNVKRFDNNSSENTKIILVKVLSEFSNHLKEYENL